MNLTLLLFYSHMLLIEVTRGRTTGWEFASPQPGKPSKFLPRFLLLQDSDPQKRRILTNLTSKSQHSKCVCISLGAWLWLSGEISDELVLDH